MADLNSYLVQKDRERIQNYIERKNLNMTESPTGLWYQILNEGEVIILQTMIKLFSIMNVHFLMVQNVILLKVLDQRKLFWEEVKWNQV